MIERQTNIPLALVVAMTRSCVIGKSGTMPWRLSDDLKWFKKVTMGKPVIMGRKTFDSIGRALPGRDNVVITQNPEFAQPNVTVAANLEDAIAIAEAFSISREAAEICIIGGGTIYKETLSLANRIYLTEIDTDIEGDTWFPDIDRAHWAEEQVSKINKNDRNDHNARVLILERIASD